MITTLLTLLKKILFSQPHVPNDRCIYINLNSNYFRRYLFTLVKLFRIEGYTIYFQVRPRFLVSLLGELYTRKIIDEQHIRFSWKPLKGVPTLSDRHLPRLSPDYFETASGYHMPMTLHPNHYVSNLWKEEYPETPRQNQLFFAGNFTPELYDHPNEQFRIINRTELLATIKRVCTVHEIEHFEQLTEASREADLLYLDTRKEIVPYEENRKTLAKYRFMLAFPGANMPLCHNIAEAFSVGTVPILQENYARHLRPPVQDGQEVFVFHDGKDLKSVVKKARAMSEEQFQKMSKKAKAYYEMNCTPKAIVENILKEKKIIRVPGAI